MIEQTLEALGVKMTLVVAGLVGGVASLAFVSSYSPKEGFAAIIGGTACAAYLTPIIAAKFNVMGSTENAIAFLLGIGGMNIIGGLFKLSAGFRKDPLRTVSDIKKLKETRDE